MKKNIGLIIGIVIVAVILFFIWQSKTSAPTQDTNSVKQEQTNAPKTPANEQASPATEQTMPTTGEKKAGFTASDVASHNNQNDCYTIVGENVYDVTEWVSKHPGGTQAIIKMCGIDATEMFTKQHGTFEKAKQALASFMIGALLK